MLMLRPLIQSVLLCIRLLPQGHVMFAFDMSNVYGGGGLAHAGLIEEVSLRVDGGVDGEDVDVGGQVFGQAPDDPVVTDVPVLLGQVAQEGRVRRRSQLARASLK